MGKKKGYEEEEEEENLRFNEVERKPYKTGFYSSDQLNSKGYGKAKAKYE